MSISGIYSRHILGQLVTGKVRPEDLELDAAAWRQLAEIAHGEGVAPLLYWVLHADHWPGVTVQAVQEYLTTVYYASLAHNELMFHELGKILIKLHEAGIYVVVLKGAALATSLYVSIGLRPMADIDLLVRSEAMERVKQIFHTSGYKGVVQDQTPGLHEMVDYHICLVGGSENRIRVEVHWGLIASPLAWYAAPVDWFWRHTEAWGDIGGASQLTPEAHLLYLSSHAMLQHGGSQALLIWLYDIHLLAQSGKIDWDELVEEAEELRWAGVVEQALRQSQAVYGTVLREEILERLRHKADANISRLVAFKNNFGGVRLLYDWYSLLALRGIPRIRYMIGMIFPQPAYMRWRYQPSPAWVWPIFYPYRWLRMLAEGYMAIRKGILRAVK